MKQIEGGFTLVELIIVAGIMVVLLTLAIANFPHARGSVALNRAAQEVALGIRDAEAGALSVAKDTVTGTFPGYGIYFNINNPLSYIIFADRDEDKRRKSDASEDQLSFTLPVFIQIIRLQNASGGSENELHIVFLRPDPAITVYNSSSNLGQGNFQVHMQHSALSGAGSSRIVSFWTTGQVSVIHP